MQEIMREITTHQVNPCNEAIHLQVLDTPSRGGACHHYRIACDGKPGFCYDLKFQKGPVAEAGFNGLTQEVLLAIIADRLEGFQASEFACVENGAALHFVRQAIDALHQRTRQRIERGVEGTHQK